MLNQKIPIGDFMEKVIDWMTNNLDGFFAVIKNIIATMIDGTSFVLDLIPVFLFIGIMVVLAWWISGKGLAIFTGIGFLLIYNIELWDKMLLTLAMVIAATVIALVIGLPLGILMAKNDTANKILRPVLDFMQTMPAFVYLIPAVYFFALGSVPGVVATVIFAMPPIVRLTNLGIREVPVNIVEAARSFGCTPGQLLFKVQVPLKVEVLRP